MSKGMKTTIRRDTQMAVKYTREVERFRARSDDGSYETVIVVTQDFVDAASLDDPEGALPGLKRARTIDGLHCNHLGNDRFRVLHREIVVTRQG